MTPFQSLSGNSLFDVFMERRDFNFKNDLQQAVKTAVINKRAGGTGLISGRKAFQRPMDEGIKILNAIQDVYLDGDIDIA